MDLHELARSHTTTKINRKFKFIFWNILLTINNIFNIFINFYYSKDYSTCLLVIISDLNLNLFLLNKRANKFKTNHPGLVSPFRCSLLKEIRKPPENLRSENPPLST